MHDTTSVHRGTRLRLIVLLLLAISASRPAVAHEGHDEPDPPMFLFDAGDRSVVAQAAADVLSYDADILTAADGTTHIVWLQYVPHEGDTIWFGTWTPDGVADARPLNEHPGRYARPTLTEAADAALWLSYEQQVDGQWDVLVRRGDGASRFGEARAVSDMAGSDIRHQVAAAGNALWFTWQSDREGQFDIVCRRVSRDAFGQSVYISDSPRGDWHPQIAVSAGADGDSVFVGWDRFDGESYDAMLRIGRIGATDRAPEWTPTLAVAGSPAFEGRVQLAAAAGGGVWIGWEAGAENWGQSYRARRGQQELYLKLGDRHGPLHRYRHLRLGHVSTDGQIRAVAHPLPQPSFDAARRRGDNALPHGAYYERAKLTVDNAGRLWIAYRHFYAPWMGVEPNHHVEGGWGLYARCLTGEGWSPLTRFDVGQGDGMQRLELTPQDAGIAAAWTSGRTDRRTSESLPGIYVATATEQGRAAGIAASMTSVTIPAAKDVTALDELDTSVDGRRPFFGDLHRHTDLSLCFVPIDGTIDDAYRYASDVARLDFLGITDHTRDIQQGDALSLLWWRCQKEVERYELPRRFLPFFAYERSRGDTDHNVVSLRSDMLRPHTYPLPEFWQELGDDTLTIPHQPFAGAVWEYQDDARRPLLEIFQGYRDRSVESDAQAGLDRGYHFGFIASSDHLSTRASYAGVWAEERSRESLFAAMQSRRTFGATDRIVLAMRCGGHWMGEQLQAAQMPPLEIEVEGTAPVRTIDVVVDGRVEQTVNPLKRRLRFSVPLSLEGHHYVYIRLEQSDGNQAWSSPIWVNIGG